jgi:hypothetical protein
MQQGSSSKDLGSNTAQEDGMASTSDFVKKLYKCVRCFHSSPDGQLTAWDRAGCWKTKRFSKSYVGDLKAIALSSRFAHPLDFKRDRTYLKNPGHERVYQIHTTPHVQTFKFRQLCTSIEQV